MSANTTMTAAQAAPATATAAAPAPSASFELRLLVLAAEHDHCAGIDLASGALVRAWTTEPTDPDLVPYDVIAGPLDHATDRLPDPTEPEAVVVLGAPSRVGRIAGRRAERSVARVLHPAGKPLLGFHGPTVPFWARNDGQPSIAVVEPEGAAVIARQGDRLWCRFTWRRLVVQLPCVDRRADRLLAAVHRRPWLETARTDRLVLALTPPIDGHCHKVVVGVLPRPRRGGR